MGRSEAGRVRHRQLRPPPSPATFAAAAEPRQRRRRRAARLVRHKGLHDEAVDAAHDAVHVDHLPRGETTQWAGKVGACWGMSRADRESGGELAQPSGTASRGCRHLVPPATLVPPGRAAHAAAGTGTRRHPQAPTGTRLVHARGDEGLRLAVVQVQAHQVVLAAGGGGQRAGAARGGDMWGVHCSPPRLPPASAPASAPAAPSFLRPRRTACQTDSPASPPAWSASSTDWLRVRGGGGGQGRQLGARRPAAAAAQPRCAGSSIAAAPSS